MMGKTTKSVLSMLIRLLLIAVFVWGIAPASAPAAAQSGGRKVHLPLVWNLRSTTNSALPLMTGIYPNGWMDAQTINNEMKPLDTWLSGVSGGRATSIFGTFLTIEITSAGNVETPLTTVWNAGYTPFINLMADASAYDVANSQAYGNYITAWARSFKNYANNGTRFAYIAPLQEMNGGWVPYGLDPTNFKKAYQRIQTIFQQVGVPRQSVKWVFAPNGWGNSQNHFEIYYPGDAAVDVVAFSAYNYGFCEPNRGWEEPEEVYNQPAWADGHYLDRIRTMAPNKPIFIAQTGATSWRQPGTQSASEKERWLRDAYAYLASEKNVRAVLYFAITRDSGNCDWGITGNAGYKTGINSNGFQYIAPSTLMNTDHSVR